MRSLTQILSFCLILNFFSFTGVAHADPAPIQVEEDWQRVYLATFPRSGNHWLRYLLEEATHIATGAVYRDMRPPHLKTPFPWGGYAAGMDIWGIAAIPILVKLSSSKHTILKSRRRNLIFCLLSKSSGFCGSPLDSFYSHFLFAGHKLPSDGKITSEFVKRSVKDWKRFEMYWNNQPNVLTIRYEDLYDRPHFYLSKILKAIGNDFSEDDVNRAIEMFPPQGGLYKHSADFHPDDLEFIAGELGGLMDNYGYIINQ